MFKKNPPESGIAGDYIVDYISDSGLIRASLFKQSIGTVAHVYLKAETDIIDGEPFFGPIHEYLTSNSLPKLSFLHMHYEK